MGLETIIFAVSFGDSSYTLHL